MFCPKSSPSHLYIGGPKGEALHLSIDFSIVWGASIVSTLFFGIAQPNVLVAKTKKRLEITNQLYGFQREVTQSHFKVN
jgi:hypothetical protein